MLRTLTILFAFSLLFSNCRKTEYEPVTTDVGQAYFPLKVGQINMFSIDSVKYNAVGNTKDSVRKFIKEIITSVEAHSSGDSTYRIELFSTKDTSKGWNYSSYYFYSTNKYHVNFVTGGGSITTDLVFPISRGIRWNINSYNHKEPQNATYTLVSKPWMEYTNCLEVFVKEDINIVEESIDKRVYSKNMGLVYKILSEVKINNDIKNGFKIITKRIE